MFGLPTNTHDERRDASNFRKFLLKDFFYMMQYSVYVRICNGLEAANIHEKRVMAAVPQKGSVRSLKITENQYATMNIICGDPIEDLDVDSSKKSVTIL